MINNKVLSKTKKNLIKINILVVVSFLILFSTFIYSYFKELTYNKIDLNLENEAKALAINLVKYGMYPSASITDPRNIIYIYKDENLLFYTPNRYFEEYENGGFDKGPFTYKEDNYTFRGIGFVIGKYYVEIIRNIDSELVLLNGLIYVFIVGIAVAIIVCYFIALYLTKKALQPIETAWQNQALFIQDASHELRTPLTIVSSKLEGMLKSPNNTINDEVENIADAMKETRRLRKMVNDLLSLTKEDNITKLNIKEINIEEFIKDISNNYTELAEIHDKKFECEYKLKQPKVNSDESKLKQLLIIFLDNAFKYTNEEDFIKLYIETNNTYLKLAIEDNGIGIGKEDLKHIFERFYRSDNVRDKEIDGSGIGLSIANMITLNLGGKINVSSKINEGSRFEILIPINQK